MVNKSELRKAIRTREKMSIGTVELIKNMTQMDRDEFVRIFYPETVA